jgi:hypothetical protein
VDESPVRVLPLTTPVHVSLDAQRQGLRDITNTPQTLATEKPAKDRAPAAHASPGLRLNLADLESPQVATREPRQMVMHKRGGGVYSVGSPAASVDFLSPRQ